MANLLLSKGLETYQKQMDDKTGANNHWSQIEVLRVDSGSDNSGWKSGLKDPRIALNFVKALDCRIRSNLSDCKNKEFGDRDVKEIVDVWKNENSSMRNRKIPEQKKMRQSTMDSYGENGTTFVPKKQSYFPNRAGLQNDRDSAGSSGNQNQESPHFASKLNLKVLNRNTNQNNKHVEGDNPTEFPRQNRPTYSRHGEEDEGQGRKNPSHSFQNRFQSSRRETERNSGQDEEDERRCKQNNHRSFQNRFPNPRRDTERNFDQEEETEERRYKKGNFNAYQNRSAYSKHDSGRNSSQDEENDEDRYKKHGIRSAKEELQIQQMKRNKSTAPPPQKKSLGGKRVNSPYVCPIRKDDDGNENEGSGGDQSESCEDERLKNIEPKMIELIKNEIMDSGAPVSWDDIAGLEFAKKTIKEIVVLPLMRPEFFNGLRSPPKGILLFGPSGTGKTLIGKCIASQSKSTFFSISASSLTSKWIGEGEKMVRALFAVARVHQPAVVFIDEIDSLLTQRSETEHESSRRLKTEFLIQLDGAATAESDRVLVVGATNRPQELDEAARRRLVKRLYVPLPEFHARSQIVKRLLSSERHNLTEDEILEIANLSKGYSGADMTNLCKEASMGPIRSLSFDQLQDIDVNDVRGITAADFKNALSYVKSSVSPDDLATYVAWDRTYGTGTAQQYGT